VAEKISALATEDYFLARASRAEAQDFAVFWQRLQINRRWREMDGIVNL
jgi:hypothetical protein